MMAVLQPGDRIKVAEGLPPVTIARIVPTSLRRGAAPLFWLAYQEGAPFAGALVTEHDDFELVERRAS